MADTREPSPRSKRTNQGDGLPTDKTQKEIDDAKKGAKTARQIIEEGGNVKLDPPTSLKIVDYKKDQEENKDFDRTLDPNKDFQKGIYKRPSVETLKKGVDIKNRTNLTIQALTGVAATGLTILKQLMINPLGGAM